MSRPRFPRLPALCAALVALAAAASLPASALVRGPYSMEILVDGVPLPELSARGTRYVEALEGREYSIRLTNHTAARIAVALSVDGLNTIDAETTSAREAAKWILGPYDSIVLDGWQTGSETARRFFFTTEERSYGEWLGRTDNLGVIAAAVFRERVPEPPPRPFVERKRRAKAGAADAAPESRRALPAPDAAAPREAEGADDFAATGIGREVDHHVRRVRFRAEPGPAQVLELRYEYREALVSLGVLPRPDCRLSRRERSRGFTDTGFAPDPFAGPRCR